MAFLWNFLVYKKAKRLCNSLNQKAKKIYFEKSAENRITDSKNISSKTYFEKPPEKRITGGKKISSTVKPLLSFT